MEKKPRHVMTNKDLDTLTGDCQVCGPGVKLKKFPGKTSFGCAEARRLVKKNSPSTKRHDNRKKGSHRIGKYGLTFAEEKRIRAEEPCEVCGSRDRVVLDHDHKRGKYRGPLCHNHNVGIGMFDDDVEDMQKAINYILRHRGVDTAQE